MPDFRVTLTRGGFSRDITAKVMELRWRLGMTRPFDTFAPAASGRIVVDNRDQSASPEFDVNGLFDPASSVLIECEYDGWRPMFTGVIAYVTPEMGEYGARRTVIHIEGREAALWRVVVRAAVMSNARADVALAAILNVPPLNTIPHDLAEGASTFAYVGDQWGDGIGADSAVRQIVDAERGRVYSSRNGVFAFRGRHFGLADNTPHTTFDADADSAQMTYGAALINHVRIGLRPRMLGTAGATVWTLANVQRLRPHRSLVLIAPLRDGQGRRAGAVSVITPVANVDFTANASPDSSGANRTASVSITVLALEGSAAKLRIDNSSDNAVYLMANTRLRGTPLLGGQPASVERSDDASITAFGQRTLSLRLPLLDSVDAADQLAVWEISHRAQPENIVHTLTLTEQTRYADALPLTLFRRIRLIDPQTGHDGVYNIVGESHVVTSGGLRHRITFTLEPTLPQTYWAVGISGLGTGTRLAV